MFDLDRPEQLTQAWPLIGSILRYEPLRQVSLGVKLAEFVELFGELTRWGGGGGQSRRRLIPQNIIPSSSSLYSVYQRIYISDRTHGTPLRLPNMCLTQPLPALSSTPLQLPDCLTELRWNLQSTRNWFLWHGMSKRRPRFHPLSPGSNYLAPAGLG